VYNLTVCYRGVEKTVGGFNPPHPRGNSNTKPNSRIVQNNHRKLRELFRTVDRGSQIRKIIFSASNMITIRRYLSFKLTLKRRSWRRQVDICWFDTYIWTHPHSQAVQVCRWRHQNSSSSSS